MPTTVTKFLSTNGGVNRVPTKNDPMTTRTLENSGAKNGDRRIAAVLPRHSECVGTNVLTSHIQSVEIARRRPETEVVADVNRLGHRGMGTMHIDRPLHRLAGLGIRGERGQEQFVTSCFRPAFRPCARCRGSLATRIRHRDQEYSARHSQHEEDSAAYARCPVMPVCKRRRLVRSRRKKGGPRRFLVLGYRSLSQSRPSENYEFDWKRP